MGALALNILGPLDTVPDVEDLRRLPQYSPAVAGMVLHLIHSIMSFAGPCTPGRWCIMNENCPICYGTIGCAHGTLVKHFTVSWDAPAKRGS